MPEPSPKGGVGFSQTKKTWKALLAEETAYKRLAGMMSSVVCGWGGTGENQSIQKCYTKMFTELTVLRSQNLFPHLHNRIMKPSLQERMKGSAQSLRARKGRSGSRELPPHTRSFRPWLLPRGAPQPQAGWNHFRFFKTSMH